MNYPLNNIFYLILISTAISVMLSYVTIWVAPFIKLMDIPGSAFHKIHHKPTPIAGGIVLIMSLTIISFLFAPEHFQANQAILVGAWIVFIFALWDDFKILPAWVKLFGQIIAVTVLINMGIQVNILNSPEFIFYSDDILSKWGNLGLTTFWVLLLTNAFNFIDSIDGLAIGLGAVSIAFYLIVTFGTMQLDLTYFCAILLGISIVLYFFNSDPAYLFLGDSGSQTLGFILAAIAITYTPEAVTQMSSWFVPILIFGVPLFDICLVILSRIRRRKRIHKAANDHVYHRLIKYGVLKGRAVIIMHFGSLLLSIIGFLCLNLEYHFANIIFIMFLIVGMLLIFFFEHSYSEVH